MARSSGALPESVLPRRYCALRCRLTLTSRGSIVITRPLSTPQASHRPCPFLPRPTFPYALYLLLPSLVPKSPGLSRLCSGLFGPPSGSPLPLPRLAMALHAKAPPGSSYSSFFLLMGVLCAGANFMPKTQAISYLVSAPSSRPSLIAPSSFFNLPGPRTNPLSRPSFQGPGPFNHMALARSWP